MRLGWRQAIAGSLGVAVICLVGVGFAGGQTAPAAKQTTPAKPAATAAKPAGQEMAGTYFKNVQVLKNIPVDEFMDTMGFLAASLSLNCTDCHIPESAGSWARYADDTQLKITSRKMMRMVNTINASNFGGAKFVTCWTCHRGGQQPPNIPSLLEQYSAPPPDDPNEYQIRDSAGEPTADQVFAKFVQAVGGQQKLDAVKSFVAKGTYEGYDTDHEAEPVRGLRQGAEHALYDRALPHRRRCSRYRWAQCLGRLLRQAASDHDADRRRTRRSQDRRRFDVPGAAENHLPAIGK